MALILEDRPGTLHSTAMPVPDGQPTHSFVDAAAMDAKSEHELGELLRRSRSFDDYLSQLIAAGYDIMSGENEWVSEQPGGMRIEDDGGPVGVLWPQAGQFTTLAWQPVAGQLTFPQATVSIYRQDLADSFLALLQKMTDYEALRQAIEDQDFRLVPLD